MVEAWPTTATGAEGAPRLLRAHAVQRARPTLGMTSAFAVRAPGAAPISPDRPRGLVQLSREPGVKSRSRRKNFAWYCRVDEAGPLEHALHMNVNRHIDVSPPCECMRPASLVQDAHGHVSLFLSDAAEGLQAFNHLTCCGDQSRAEGQHALFDHLIRANEDGLRDRQTEHLRGLEVEH